MIVAMHHDQQILLIYINLNSRKSHESGTTPVTKDTVMLTENPINKNSNATDHRSAEIILIGDSIIKQVNPRKLTKKSE